MNVRTVSDIMRFCILVSAKFVYVQSSSGKSAAMSSKASCASAAVSADPPASKFIWASAKPSVSFTAMALTGSRMCRVPVLVEMPVGAVSASAPTASSSRAAMPSSSGTKRSDPSGALYQTLGCPFPSDITPPAYMPSRGANDTVSTVPAPDSGL